MFGNEETRRGGAPAGAWRHRAPGVGIKQHHGLVAIAAHDDFHPGMAEQTFIFIQTGAVIEIAQHDQAVAAFQMIFDARANPDALGQLLAPVVDGYADLLGQGFRAVGGLGFCMHPDQADRRAANRVEIDLERGLGKADHLVHAVNIQIDVKAAIETRRLLAQGGSPRPADWIVAAGADPGVVHQGDFLPGFGGKTAQRAADAQPETCGKVFQRPDR